MAHQEALERENQLRAELLKRSIAPLFEPMAQAVAQYPAVPSRRLESPAGQALLSAIDDNTPDESDISVALYDANGKILFSNHTYKIDKTLESPAFDQAIGGSASNHIDQFTTADTEGEQREQTWVVSYLPLPEEALPFAAISLERNHTQLLAALAQKNHRALMTEGLAFIAFYVALMLSLSVILRNFRRSEARHRNLEQKLQEHTFYDQVTGLPNRQNFIERLEYLFKSSAEGSLNGPFAVLLTDLDSFKVINESLGHQAGNQLLKSVGHRLNRCVGPNDLVARMGGDEYGLIIENIDDVTEAIQTAKNIHEQFQEPYMIQGHRVSESISIGVAISQGQNQTAEELIRDADIAMSRAKQNGRGHYELFNVEMHQEAVNRIELENSIRHGLERREFFNRYHPIIDVESGLTVSAEALVRWNHPERGELAPNHFIPLAEEIGLVKPLDQQVLDKALADLCVWKKHFPEHSGLTVNVNHSAQHFHGRPSLEVILNSLEAHSLRGRDLKLELTESSILKNDLVASALFGELRKMGVHLCMDDFGTGFSSLSYLHKLSFDMLKIDMSFVAEMLYSDEARKIVHSIIEMGNHLGLGVTAEGVETQEQLDILKSMGCRYAQGYLFSKPLLAEEIPDFIQKRIDAQSKTAENLA
ncbi:diguanylate cyclase/phosphodiesterase with PAS/PAC sensor [gamma proteobacterium HTCC5015]|nr:diguanylate cyclase/phosphodiesterase with PAS/PAC sensor [gamma proteobacterium HTCC5015]